MAEDKEKVEQARKKLVHAADVINDLTKEESDILWKQEFLDAEKVNLQKDLDDKMITNSYPYDQSKYDVEEAHSLEEAEYDPNGKDVPRLLLERRGFSDKINSVLKISLGVGCLAFVIIAGTVSIRLTANHHDDNHCIIIPPMEKEETTPLLSPVPAPLEVIDYPPPLAQIPRPPRRRPN